MWWKSSSSFLWKALCCQTSSKHTQKNKKSFNEYFVFCCNHFLTRENFHNQFSLQNKRKTPQSRNQRMLLSFCNKSTAALHKAENTVHGIISLGYANTRWTKHRIYYLQNTNITWILSQQKQKVSQTLTKLNNVCLNQLNIKKAQIGVVVIFISHSVQTNSSLIFSNVFYDEATIWPAAWDEVRVRAQ